MDLSFMNSLFEGNWALYALGALIALIAIIAWLNHLYPNEGIPPGGR